MCDPYACGATAPAGRPAPVDADCVAPYTCIGGSCGQKADRRGLRRRRRVHLGLLRAGRLLRRPRAAAPASRARWRERVGTCTNVPAGTDPLNQCADHGVATLRHRRQCNGSGACRRTARGRSARRRRAPASTVTPARTCNGTGACQTRHDVQLRALRVRRRRLPDDLRDHADCASPNSLQRRQLRPEAGRRRVRAATASATRASARRGSAAPAPARAPAGRARVAGTLGTCTNVPSGQDPLNQCTDAGAASCGTDGTCNGGGACRLYAAGTTCVAATCTGLDAHAGAHVQRHRHLPGGHHVHAATPYVCGTGACRTTCTVDGDCVSPNICSRGVCTKRPNGAACTAGERLRERHLRAGRLLRGGLHGDLQVVRAGRHARHVHQRRRPGRIR